MGGEHNDRAAKNDDPIGVDGKFADPHLRVHAEEDEIVVEADAYARAVEISNARDDLVLSDNFFDMNAGVVRVKILRGTPDGLRVRSVYDIR